MAHTASHGYAAPEPDMQAPPQYTQAPSLQHRDSEQDAHALLGDYQQRWTALPPQLRSLAAPVCLPQVIAERDAAFARGYNEHMMASGITMGDWLRFLDALNNAMAGSPPLRIVSKAAKIAGFATMGASTAVQLGISLTSAAAGGGQAAVQKSLSDRVVALANEELFAPRGLVVRICTTEAVRVLVRTGQELPELEGMDKYAKGALDVSKKLPIIGRIVRRLGPDAEHLPEDPHMSLTERRIASLAPYAMPMNMNVPPPAAGQSWTERSNANYLQQQAAKAARKEGRADQHRHLLAVGHGEAEPGSGPSSFGDSRRGGRRLVIGERRAMRAQESGRGSRLGERRVETSNLQDDQKTEDVLWVVLLNIEQDRLIESLPGV